MEHSELGIMKALVDIFHHDRGSRQEFLDYALSTAISQTGSVYGYIYFYSEETQQFELNTWSRGVMESCSVIEPQTRYQLSKTGIWGEAVRQRKPIIVNDFEAENPLKKGYPQGHVHLTRFMTIPIISGDTIVAVVGVANKKEEYADSDVTRLSLLMDAVWKVTSLRAAEQELKKSNELLSQKDLMFNLFLEHSPIYVFFKDEEMRSLYLSRNFEQMIGRPLDQLLGKNMFELFPGDFAKKIVEDDKRIAAAGVPVSLEESLDGKDYVTIKFPIIQPDRDPMLAGFTIDVTEEHRAKEELRKAALEWQTTFDASSDAIFLLDAESAIRRYNRRAKQIFSITENDAVGRHCWEIAHGTSAPIPGCPVERSRKSKQRESMELEIGGRWYRITADPILDDSGELTGFVHTVSDITEQKDAADALAEKSEYLAAVFDAMNQALFIIDGETQEILGVNKQTCEMYGCTKEELVFRSTDTLALEDPPYSAIDARRWFDAAREKGPQSFEWRARRKDGTPFWAEASIVHTTINGKPRFIAALTDIDRRKKMESALTNAQRLESLGILAGGIAHDFNNLLGGIFGYLSLALHRCEDPEVRTFLEKALLAKERTQALTRQLLTFAKGGTPKRSPGRLFPFIQETVEFALSGSSARCEFHVPDDIHGANFDRNQIGQVFDNLVINAIQAMPLGGTITVSAENISIRKGDVALLDSGDYVRISVADTGTGIPAGFVERIFDPFFTTKQTGSGLGLATVFSILRQHEGAIEVESKPGKGTTFRVYLPAESDVPEERSEKETAEHKGEGKILVMDDEEIIINLLRDTLALAGYTAVCASSADEAIGMFERETRSGGRFAAAILDLTIPGSRGGIDVANALKMEDPSLPIFISSGYADSPAMSSPESYGFTACIEKPFSVADIMNILSRHLPPRNKEHDL